SAEITPDGLNLDTSSSYASILNSNDFNPFTTHFILSAWIKSSKTDYSIKPAFIVGHGNPASGLIHLGIIIDTDNAIKGVIYRAGIAANVKLGTSTPIYIDTEWHYVQLYHLSGPGINIGGLIID